MSAYSKKYLRGATDTLEIPVAVGGFYTVSLHGTGWGSVDCNYKDSASGDEGDILDPKDGTTALAMTGNRAISFEAPEDTLVFDLTGGSSAEIEVNVKFSGFRK